MNIEIFYSNEQDKLIPPEDIEQLIEQCTRAALEEEGIDDDAQVSVTLVDNESIREINREHRDIDKATDVLSFPLGDDDSFDTDPETGAILLGDIVISLERADEQAKEFGHSFRREVAFLITHSLFHLLGYDHVDSDEDEKLMFGKQDKVLQKLGITRES
ncbi:MAG: rRNA maturation RNase YbeY [Oscillospiraceae bacterium]|nr:rRNA maturation RNase YbeY [Oscillospiraceae bacterium]